MSNTYTVTTTADSGAGSLRAAIALANADPGSTISFALPQNATITLLSELPHITTNLTIDGADSAGLTISGNNAVRVFFVESGTVSIENLNIADGFAKGGDGGDAGGGGGLGAGGAIFVNAGTITVANVTFTNNKAEGGDGGASAANSAGGGGGGLTGDGHDGSASTGGNGGGPNGGTGGLPNSPGGDGVAFSGGGGGGGAASFAGSNDGGDGAFGSGGGGAGPANAGSLPSGGSGGYGAGGGGGSVLSQAGFGGGGGGSDGGGGAALGGAVFVRGGASLLIKDGSFASSGLTAGSAGGADAGGGIGMGSDLFMMQGVTVTLAPDAGKTLVFTGAIRDDGNTIDTPPSMLEIVGAGAAVVIGDGTSAGTVVIGSPGATNWPSASAWAHGTTFKSGTLELAGVVLTQIDFSAGAQTLKVDDAALINSGLFTTALKSFGAGDIIDLTGLAFAPGAHASFGGTSLVVTSGANTVSLSFSSPSSTTFLVRSDGASGTIVSLDSAPTDIALSHASVAENSANGTLIGTLSSTDVDLGDTATYTLADNAGGRFAISGNNLVVADGTLLDFESSATHSITVHVTDSGGLTFDKQFTIGLTNVNEAPTDILPSIAYIPENSPNGTVVGILSDLDPDAGDSATFTLLDDDGGRFALNGKNLVVANGMLLDFESSATHSVKVRVTDSGGLTFDKQLTIGLMNVNEAPTDILLSHASVAENSPNGTVIGTLTDVDPDAGDTPSAVTLTDDAGGRFAIVGNLLVVANGSLLDFESKAAYSVTVRVADGPGLTFDKQFTIDLTNVNEAPTDILLSHSGVAENSPNGTVVGALSDVDPDAGDSATFTLLDNDGGRFALNGSNLVVANGSLLDFAQHQTETVKVRVTDGSGAHLDKTLTIDVIDVPDAPHTPAPAATYSDFDGDAHSDILWQNANGTPAIWTMNGTSLTSGANAGFNPGPAWHVIGSGDFNGDHKADILWQNTDGAAAVWLMDGTKIISGQNVGINPGPAWHAIGTGDFNGDGKSDILWQNNDGAAAVWLMDGQTLLSGTNVGSNPGPAWHVIGAGDFDGDGKSDILWQNSNGQAAVWLMNGTSLTSGQNVGPNPGPGWHAVGTGDFNGDGKADILWQNADGTPAIWLMNGTSLTSGQNVGFNPGPAWHAVNTGDYNGDGKSDILWQNNDGTAAVWLMNGTSLVSGANVGTDPGTSWHVVAQHHDMFG